MTHASILITACLALPAALTAAQAPLFTPETSRHFHRYVEPATGVVSWIMNKPFMGVNQQSLYFTHKSMTDDGRFLLFHISGGGFGNANKLLAVHDFKTDTAQVISSFGGIPFLDVKTAQVYYIARNIVYRHDLTQDPLRAIELCPLPKSLLERGKIHYTCTHLTLTTDRKKAFLDMKINERYVQGLLHLETGEFTEWGETDFFVNHGQIHPFREDIALCAWEGLNGRKGPAGIYERLWLMEPGGKRTMIPPAINNYATHEHWSEDGKGFYYCSSGVHYHDLQTGQQHTIVPMPAAHAAVSADNSMVTFDVSYGKWYRGCGWRIGFYNMKTKKGFYFYDKLPVYNSIDNQSKLHPDPHPQFVCNDRYIISTVNLSNGDMDLSVTPVQPLLERTE